MKRVAIIVSLVVLAVVVAGLLLVFPPKGPVQSWLVQQVKNATGQEPRSMAACPSDCCRGWS